MVKMVMVRAIITCYIMLLMLFRSQWDLLEQCVHTHTHTNTPPRVSGNITEEGTERMQIGRDVKCYLRAKTQQMQMIFANSI